ncbi:hypothetical protein CRG98_018640 [Punica granatum]|uniref:Uncharacterized protein n=1 Tax=Punica granatum TaxID=22663 RepID=A0A2I0JXC1_PUNGR|nr:hypothetical protein CRG98_018640 [Punica granatum]
MLFIRYAPRACCKPFEYVPTTFLLRGPSPFGYVPTIFLLKGPSPSGTSRLLFCTGVRPLRVCPDYFSLHHATRRAKRPAPRKSIGGPSPSGTSQLLFYTGVRPLRLRPDYFSAQGSIPFGYVPTTFLLRGLSSSGTSRLLFYTGVRTLRVGPDYFSAQGSVPFGYVPTTFLHRVRPLRVRPDFKLLFRGPSPRVCLDFYISASVKEGQAVSTPFWLTFPNNDISNGPDYDFSRNTENGSAEQEITIHPQVDKIEQKTCTCYRRTPRVTKGSFSTFRVKNRYSRVNSASRVPAVRPPARPRPPRAPAVHSSRKPCQSDQRHIRARFGGIPRTQGLPGSWNKLQTTFRNSTGFLEGRFSGSKRLPVNLRGTSTENRDHSDPRTPQDIRGTLRKPRSQVPRSSRGNGLRSGTTSQRSPTRQKAHRHKHYNAQKEQSKNRDG